uniref:Uncharacterized protein n=1 Tax=Tanacetum cinerariifolium TaxID=118510 RepID=A0A699JNF3_TANCI|nr:hypothetical protein [Tanacetum cinerariifolium]
MVACHDVDMNCFHFNVRRLLDFVDVLAYFNDTDRVLIMRELYRVLSKLYIGLYPCHIKEKMTIKEVRGESVMVWKTKMTTKEGIVIQFPEKFRGYKLATEDEMEENEGLKEVWEQMEYVISDNDSDLESITSS